MWDKIGAWLKREWEAVKKSGTMLWAWVQAAVGILGVALLDLFNDPSINDAIKSVLKPEYIPWFVIGAAILLRFVRRKNATDL